MHREAAWSYVYIDVNNQYRNFLEKQFQCSTSHTAINYSKQGSKAQNTANILANGKIDIHICTRVKDVYTIPAKTHMVLQLKNTANRILPAKVFYRESYYSCALLESNKAIVEILAHTVKLTKRSY